MSDAARYARAWQRAEALGITRQLADVADRAVSTFEQAAKTYDAIRWGDEPNAVVASSAPLVRAGETLPVLGVLEYVEYSGSKAGRSFIWYHPFERRKPWLCVSSDQKLVVVGGDYKVTHRGIVG